MYYVLLLRIKGQISTVEAVHFTVTPVSALYKFNQRVKDYFTHGAAYLNTQLRTLKNATDHAVAVKDMNRYSKKRWGTLLL